MATRKKEVTPPTKAAPKASQVAVEAPKKETVKTLRADRDMLVSALEQAKESLEYSQKVIEELQAALEYEKGLGFFAVLFDRLSRSFK